MEGMHARALYAAFDAGHIASMIAALARDFAPVCVVCLGDAELPAYEIDGAVEIHRLPGTLQAVAAILSRVSESASL